MADNTGGVTPGGKTLYVAVLQSGPIIFSVFLFHYNDQEWIWVQNKQIAQEALHIPVVRITFPHKLALPI